MTLRRAFASAAVTTVFVVTLAGCSSSDSDGSDVETDVGEAVTVVSTTEPAETTTTTTAAPTTTTTLPSPVGAPTGAKAARTLYEAWTNDDRAAAATVAEPEAIEVVWTAIPGPYELYRNCDDGEFDTGGCMFRDRSTNNTIQINLEKRDDQWVVVGAFFSEG